MIWAGNSSDLDLVTLAAAPPAPAAPPDLNPKLASRSGSVEMKPFFLCIESLACH